MLALASLCVALSSCSATDNPATAPVKTSIPAQLVKQTPAPIPPNPDTMSDNELGTFIQNQDKAIAQCNADKRDIAKLVDTQ